MVMITLRRVYDPDQHRTFATVDEGGCEVDILFNRLPLHVQVAIMTKGFCLDCELRRGQIDRHALAPLGLIELLCGGGGQP